MEIGHNVMHGQWDWMNDPEIHSSNWEWDTAQPAEQWKHSHNYIHHQFTNVLGHDNDIGYGILRMAREQKWHPVNLGQPVYNALLAGLFQWGVALHDLDLEAIRKGKKDPKEMKRQLRQIGRKGRNQILKDYVVYPALSGRAWKSTIKANATANFMRNVWSYMIIFCGHFPDGALHFTEEELEDETRSEWYLRQMLGSANFEGSRLLHILSGSLGYQIEHHLFPDLPSNRYPEIAVKVRALCDKYDIPYTTGPLHRQYGQALRTIMKLSLPNGMSSSDQPEPPSPSIDRGRKTDAERPQASYRDRRLVPPAGDRDAHRGRPGPRAELGHPVRAVADLRRLRDVAGPAGGVPRYAGGGRPQRVPPAADARRLRRGAGAYAGRRPALAAGDDGRVRVRPARPATTWTGEPRFEPNSLL